MGQTFRNIIFDLDGTLTNPSEGIINSLRFALDKMNFKELPNTVPDAFIGPPLQQGFAEVFGMNKKETDQAVRFFREYYGQYGLFENTPFAGINELLATLTETGKTLFVATSKLEEYAWKVIRYFEFDKYIKDIAGADYSGNHSKSGLIESLIDKYHLIKSETIMIGDTDYDIIGARDAGIDCVAVTYGFGKRIKLQLQNPLKIVDSTEELLEFLE